MSRIFIWILCGMPVTLRAEVKVLNWLKQVISSRPFMAAHGSSIVIAGEAAGNSVARRSRLSHLLCFSLAAEAT